MSDFMSVKAILKIKKRQIKIAKKLQEKGGLDKKKKIV